MGCPSCPVSLPGGLTAGAPQPVRQCSESPPPRGGPVMESGVARDAKAIAPPRKPDRMSTKTIQSFTDLILIRRIATANANHTHLH
ncbi:hypothetical protein F01_430003 [Burkholderia cenocepacia]|nr:hypothetical protein F01_430003 [Burkholderia cenocepacia]